MKINVLFAAQKINTLITSKFQQYLLNFISCYIVNYLQHFDTTILDIQSKLNKNKKNSLEQLKFLFHFIKSNVTNKQTKNSIYEI